MGLLRFVLQNSAGEREVNLVLLIGAVILAIMVLGCALVVPIVLKYHTGEYGHMGHGGGKDVNSWIDERLMDKLIRLLDKFELEKKLGNKKNQRLLEAVDKNERKRAVFALFCMVTTRLPGYMVALAFDRVYKSIRRIIVRKVVLVKCCKNSMMKSVSKILGDISRIRDLL